MPEKVTPPNPEQALQALKETLTKVSGKPGLTLEGSAMAIANGAQYITVLSRAEANALGGRQSGIQVIIEDVQDLKRQFDDVLRILSPDHSEYETVRREGLMLEIFLMGVAAGVSAGRRPPLRRPRGDDIGIV